MTLLLALMFLAFPVGPLSAAMAEHILLMNVVAPLCAAAIGERRAGVDAKLASGAVLSIVTCLQIAALWIAHSPAVLSVGAGLITTGLSALCLFLIATVFWASVFAQRAHQTWRALLALLITGKLYCMLGVLIVFAPRVLYAHHHGAGAPVALADQQLAGLIMTAACPLSYVLAATAIAARWLLMPTPEPRRQAAT